MIGAINTLDVIGPTAATVWMPTLNDAVGANHVHAGTNKKYYWRCVRRHVWRAPVSLLVNAHQNQPPDRDRSTIG